MSLSITTGAKSLIQLGISLSDIALLVNHARRFGNWLGVSKADDELFSAISEVRESIMQRKGLIDPARMAARWTRMELFHQTAPVEVQQANVAKENEELDRFAWLMISVVAAVDICLPPDATQALLVDLLSKILDADEEMRASLVVLMPTNIESWRSAGRVRGLPNSMMAMVQRSRNPVVQLGPGQQSSHQQLAIAQLNSLERSEFLELLYWLIAGNTDEISRSVVSKTVFALSESLRGVGLHITTGDRKQNYDHQPLVKLAVESSGREGLLAMMECHGASTELQRTSVQAMQVAYHKGEPESMINALEVNQSIQQRVLVMWYKGKEAAQWLKLVPRADFPVSAESEVQYTFEEDIKHRQGRYNVSVSNLADHAFRFASHIADCLKAVDYLVTGKDQAITRWLNQHASLEYLLRDRPDSDLEPDSPYMQILSEYQALVFGFYFQLLLPLVSFEHVAQDTYFRGLWGRGSTRFLAMCTQFGHLLSVDGSVSRTHVLYMLAAMYNGRDKIYSPKTSGTGLLAILGAGVSIVTMPLVKISDDPLTIGRFAVVDLPMINLFTEGDGELWSGKPPIISYVHGPDGSGKVVPQAPTKKWSVYTQMGLLIGQPRDQVVMAARCDGTLVGWFSPLAADVVFLSSACVNFNSSDKDANNAIEPGICGYEILDEDWQMGNIRRPSFYLDDNGSSGQFIVVQSSGCPALRYAAAGILAAGGDEIAVATDSFNAAFGRIEMQGGGFIVA